MFVRIRYKEFGIEKGYTTHISEKEQFLQRLGGLGIDVDWITSFEVAEPGSSQWKKYDVKHLRE